ncbi:hypothetical protein J6590_083583 [Homalodisca vitripennis]|nr:hypothetical protein J6590_083583 [Homalodisca vitripennis]
MHIMDGEVLEQFMLLFPPTGRSEQNSVDALRNTEMVHVLILVVLVATVGATREIEFKKCKSTSGKHSGNK